MRGKRAVIGDNGSYVTGSLLLALEPAGYAVRSVPYHDEALMHVRSHEADIVFAAVAPAFDGEGLCRRVKALAPSCPVVLVYPIDELDPAHAAHEVGADAWLTPPLTRAKVEWTLRTLQRLAEVPAPVSPRPAVSTEFESFKQILLLEVRRARRYRQPAAFLLAATDGLPPIAQVPHLVPNVRERLRDVDLAVTFPPDKLLVFLPHTGFEGALHAANRLQPAIAAALPDPSVSISIGVSAYDPRTGPEDLSFGSLLRAAAESLKRAQAEGGGRIEGVGSRRARERVVMV